MTTKDMISYLEQARVIGHMIHHIRTGAEPRLWFSFDDRAQLAPNTARIYTALLDAFEGRSPAGTRNGLRTYWGYSPTDRAIVIFDWFVQRGFRSDEAQLFEHGLMLLRTGSSIGARLSQHSVQSWAQVAQQVKLLTDEQGVWI